MFKNILIPTDGSRSANRAVKKGFQLAKQLGAKVIGYSAIEPMPPHVYEEGYSIGGTTTVKALERLAREIGQEHLDGMARLAAATGIAFSGVVGKAETPYEGIIQAAKKYKCDAIVMASHGRRGLADLILGSVTHKVLTHSKLPVLVFR
jgi:nucleotide-binding universal stress UspA family protein